ncbi:TIM barrel protein [Maritimibacter dapengensis]|uniref:TIM barrel protein n=1 Tax=Maritimibacter dapengensis TaxID=2836868 RepID=A0ABS6T6I4_9RHOB|nr:TIM barrel protein [Maritimibacter dapengensis]MBV7380824.1 TIM barrel protein [Maritimibacter dapengensis]
MKKALNQMTVPHLSFEAFLDLAADLGCIGVEARNDLDGYDRPLFDGMDPADAGAMVRAKGLRLVGLSQVYPFNTWDDERASEVRDLIATAKDAGAETISLIPRNDGTQGANGERQANLRIALKDIYPMLVDADMHALVEPLGFNRSSLRFKSELIETIKDLGVADRVRIVHDTFHHILAGGGEFFPEHTGIVHISAVVDPALAVDQMEDEHRVLVGEEDRLENAQQISALLAAGYDGPVSYECFAPETQQLTNPKEAIAASFAFIESRITAEAL